MKKGDVKQISKIINEVLNALRKQLTDEVTNAKCPICNEEIFSSVIGWKNGHVPHYSIEGGKIEVGYRCPKSENPVVIYRISLDVFIKALEGGEEGTKYLE